MKKIFATMVCLSVLLGEAYGGDKVRLSVSSVDVAFLTAGVALKRGFFQEEGLEPEVIRMIANVSISALATGDIDYTLIFGSVVRGAMRGLPVRVVASFMDSSTHTLIAQPNIRSAKDLKGKTLGVSTVGATADVAARMMMKHLGVDPDKEMKIVALGPAQARFAALKQGVVNVAVVSPPSDSEGEKMGYRVLARAYELFTFPFVGLGANVKKIEKQPDEVKRVIKALIKANRYIKENREGAIQVIMDWSRTDRENAAASYDATVKVFNVDGNMPEDGLRRVIDQAKASLKTQQQFSISDVADFGPLKAAQRELGVKGK